MLNRNSIELFSGAKFRLLVFEDSKRRHLDFVLSVLSENGKYRAYPILDCVYSDESEREAIFHLLKRVVEVVDLSSRSSTG